MSLSTRSSLLQSGLVLEDMYDLDVQNFLSPICMDELTSTGDVSPRSSLPNIRWLERAQLVHVAATCSCYVPSCSSWTARSTLFSQSMIHFHRYLAATPNDQATNAMSLFQCRNRATKSAWSMELQLMKRVLEVRPTDLKVAFYPICRLPYDIFVAIFELGAMLENFMTVNLPLVMAALGTDSDLP
ncbi:hypothetical protein L218DRAFT_1009704 [Marasmius fiardii PR-910]|nr:hypothetical protein L218DRAFT_1009704 [Marasmius fiardii PR-910]